MRLVCAPETFTFPDEDDVLHVVLYGQPGRSDRGSAGASARFDILRARLEPRREHGTCSRSRCLL